MHFTIARLVMGFEKILRVKDNQGHLRTFKVTQGQTVTGNLQKANLLFINSSIGITHI